MGIIKTNSLKTTQKICDIIPKLNDDHLRELSLNINRELKKRAKRHPYLPPACEMDVENRKELND